MSLRLWVAGCAFARAGQAGLAAPGQTGRAAPGGPSGQPRARGLGARAAAPRPGHSRPRPHWGHKLTNPKPLLITIVMSINRTALRRLAAATGVLALTFSAAACGSSTSSEGSSSGKIKVATSFYPVNYLVQSVGGSHVEANSVTPANVEPHDFELSPKDVTKLSSAKMVVYVAGFQSSLDDAVKQVSGPTVVNLASSVKLEKHADHDGDDHDHEAAASSSATEAAHDDHDHDHGSTDPHFWLDPTRMADAAKQVHAALVKADPSHKADYDANLKTTLAKLTKLDTSYKQGLSQCTRKTFVTSHAAFGYLAERYGLTQVSVSGIDPDSEPSPADIAKVKQVVKQTGTTTIFTEELVSPKTAQAVAKETGAKTSVLSPIESAPEKGDYEGAMTTNLTNLREALNCK